MRRFALLGGLILGASLFAQDDAKPTKDDTDVSVTAQTELDALEEELREAQREYYKPYSEAKTEEERAKIQLDPEKNPTRLFVPRYQELAHRYPRTDVALASLNFVLSAATRHEGGEVEATLEILIRDHIENPKLKQTFFVLQWYGNGKGVPHLRRIMAETSQESVTGMAKYHLAKALLRMNKVGDSAEEEARALLEDVRRTGGDLTMRGDLSYAMKAKADLYELDHLQVGMTAPETAGTDVHGEEMRLTSFRGKVVLLDFWGNW